MPKQVGIAAGAFTLNPLAAPNLEAACDNRANWLTFVNRLTRISQ